MKKYFFLLLTTLFISGLLIHCSSDDEPPITLKNTLTTEVAPFNSGSVSPASGTYDKGSKISLNAIPANGYIFKNWSGGISGNSNPISLTMNGDKKVTAVFERITDPETYIISDSDWENTFVEVDTTNYTFIFNKSLMNNYNILVGDFIVGTVDGGYLRKIDKILESGNNIQLETEFASITQAFEELNVSADQLLVPDFGSDKIWHSDGVVLEELSNKGNSQLGTKIAFQYDENINNLNIKGNYSLSADFKMKVEVGIFKLKKIEFQYGINQNQNLVATLINGTNISGKKRILYHPYVPILVGGIYIQPAVEVYIGYQASVSVEQKLKFQQEYKSITTVTSLNGRNWSVNKSLQNSKTFDKPEITSQLSAKIFLEPRISYKVFNVAGPYINMELFGSAKIEAKQNRFDWETKVGLLFGTGVHMKIFAVYEADYNEKIFDIEYLIANGSVYKDSDNDGIKDNVDECPNTPSGQSVNSKGCSSSQLDSDNDGVKDDVDECPNTPSGQSVNSKGCADSQLDSDNDGVKDNIDDCPNTPSGQSVNSKGCADSQLDSDNDGVKDNVDECPNTPSGQSVNSKGCADSQLDSDNDGVKDDVDECPNTPSGQSVNSKGCSDSQLDTDDNDEDGVLNVDDLCPNTPSGETADANGCSNSQLDDDNDGVFNNTDQCPDTPQGVTVDEKGCPVSIIADFTADKTSINEGESINFTDQSTDSPTSWTWDFGDGDISTEQHPIHTYNTEGNYTISLIATNDYGSDTETKNNYVIVSSNDNSWETSTVTDIDGNVYPTVIIGTQEWMAEDLRVTTYPNGDAIPHITDNTAWFNLGNNNTDDAYSFYNNDNTTDYGALYSYAAAIADNWTRDNNANQGICPNDWHIPTDAEWRTLTDYLGGISVAGAKMRETGNTHWSFNIATNSSGFTALPGGMRANSNGTFFGLIRSGWWWSGTESNSSSSNYLYIFHTDTYVTIGHYPKSAGFCVRCIRD